MTWTLFRLDVIHNWGGIYLPVCQAMLTLISVFLAIKRKIEMSIVLPFILIHNFSGCDFWLKDVIMIHVTIESLHFCLIATTEKFSQLQKALETDFPLCCFSSGVFSFVSSTLSLVFRIASVSKGILKYSWSYSKRLLKSIFKKKQIQTFKKRRQGASY